MIKFLKKYPADKTISKKVPSKYSAENSPQVAHSDNYIWESMVGQTTRKYGGPAGKGDAPRNCFSDDFKANYQAIDWHKEEQCQT